MMAKRFVGIDAAGSTFAAAIWNQDTNRTQEVTLQNSQDGFVVFYQWLDEHGVDKKTPICVENTGVYSEALCYALHEVGFAVLLVDPNKVWKAFPSGTPKTDPLDARKIAEYGFRYLDRLTPWKPNQVVTEQIRVLLATREHLVQQRTATKNANKALSRKVVKTAVATGALETIVQELTEQINRIEQEIAELIRRRPTLASNVSLIKSTPGFKMLFAAQLLVITDGFRRSATYRPLAQHIGIAPNPYESGATVRRRSRSRGYGPRTARKLLHLAARSVVTHNKQYRHYYLRKIEEGKPRQLVLNNVANKLLKTVCAILREQQPYTDNYRSLNPTLMT